MRKSMFLMPFMAALALTSCSNNEPMAPESFDDSFDGQAYMRVRIAMSDGSGTRAAGDFVNGSAEEQAIADIGLKFYNSDGSFYGYGFPIDNPTVTQTTPDGGNIEGKVSEAVIVLQINSNAPKPTHVVAFVNCGENWKLSSEPNIDAIDKYMIGYTNTYNGKEYYAMTSSNYSTVASGTADFLAGYKTYVDPTKFKPSETDALAAGAPVDLYVERLAAKVKVSTAEEMTPDEITNGDYTLDFVIDGYALGGIEPESFYIKNVDSRWSNTSLWPDWNSVENHRCYWAADKNYYEKNIVPPLKYVSYNGVRASLTEENKGKWLYSTENTQASFGSNNSNGPTDVTAAPRFSAADVNRYQFQEFAYVIGHYVVKKNGVEVKPADPNDLNDKDQYLFECAGNILPADVMLVYMYNNLSNVVYERKENGADYAATYTPVDILKKGWLEIGRYQNDASLVCLKLTSEATDTELQNYYVKDKNAGKDDSGFRPIVDRADLESLLKQNEIQAYGFKYDAEAGGYLAYFPILIKHLNTEGENPLNTGEDARGYYGVVRNHCYNITINSIKGLGIGIYDPDVDIIPKDKIKPLYLGATINVLSWRVVNQNVDL